MEIVELKRNQYKDYELVFKYETSEQYAVSVCRTESGFAVELRKEKLPGPTTKSFSENLFQHYLARPSVYAVLLDGKPAAFIEIDREFWIKRLRITDLLVLPEHRRRGYGAALIQKAKEIAEAEGFRALFLDTHSCNVNAIDFYLSQGFTLGGLDTTYYSNHDIERGEVWIGLVYLLDNEAGRHWLYGAEE
jgi:ribosomal protein S18 acetylase RimI-like enzyme